MSFISLRSEMYSELSLLEGIPPVHISIMVHPRLQISEPRYDFDSWITSGASQGIVPLIV